MFEMPRLPTPIAILEPGDRFPANLREDISSHTARLTSLSAWLSKDWEMLTNFANDTSTGPNSKLYPNLTWSRRVLQNNLSWPGVSRFLSRLSPITVRPPKEEEIARSCCKTSSNLASGAAALISTRRTSESRRLNPSIFSERPSLAVSKDLRRTLRDWS